MLPCAGASRWSLLASFHLVHPGGHGQAIGWIVQQEVNRCVRLGMDVAQQAGSFLRVSAIPELKGAADGWEVGNDRHPAASREFAHPGEFTLAADVSGVSGDLSNR